MILLSPYPMLMLPEVVGREGLLTDGDWVESKDQDPSGPIRLTQLADVGDGEFRDRSDRWINDEQASRLNVTLLQPGDVLIARMPDPLGRACVCPPLPTPAITAVDVCIVRAPAHNPKWLMHAINAPQTRAQVASLQSGSTRKRISKANLSTIPIPMPRRAEQDRIVAAIETHFSRLDAAVASLQRAKANVKRARASVLQAAVEGRLVPTEAALARAEGRDYEPASALLARILAERKAAWAASGARGNYMEPVTPQEATLPELAEGWCWASMDAIAEVVGGLTKDAKRVTGRPVPYLRVANVQRGRLDLSDVRTILATEPQIAALRLEPGDVLLNEGGDRDKLGRGWIWRGELPECIHQNHVFRARLWLPAFDSRFLSHYTNTEGDRYFVREGKQTTNLASISLTKVKALPVALPPAAEVERILTEVDRRLSVLDALDAALDASLARCARLRQAILQRAFSGRLVPGALPPTDRP